jgi:hypothetical protein
MAQSKGKMLIIIHIGLGWILPLSFHFGSPEIWLTVLTNP